MKESSALRRRWKDPEILRMAQTDLAAFLRGEHPGGSLDLRGATLGDELDLRLIDASVSGIDASWGKGVVIVHSSSITDLAVRGFHFDRASRFYKCQIINSDFRETRGQYNCQDAHFID